LVEPYLRTVSSPPHKGVSLQASEQVRALDGRA
jgi:hypothetical protein